MIQTMKAAAGAVALILMAGAAHATDLTVLSSGGFTPAYRALAPGYEEASHNHLTLGLGPSMGTTANAIPMRLQRHEPADVVIMVGYALDKLIQDGRAVPGSRVDLARSSIGMAVRAGAPKPDISTVEAFKRTLLNAKSVAYSDSASGVYIETTLFKRLGIEDQMKGKSRMIQADPVGGVVASGGAELGFQQISELKPIAGIDIVGPIPDELQSITVFSAGIAAESQHQTEARQLIQFLAAPTSDAAITASGMEPAHGEKSQ